jgi:hypothetical protein
LITLKYVNNNCYCYIKNENDKINRQYQSKLEDEKATNVSQQQTANYDFKAKFIETKNYAKVSFIK